MKTIHVLGGGTFSHVRTHLALAAPAFGHTAINIADRLLNEVEGKHDIVLHLTKMADSNSALVTNDDVERLLNDIVADPDTKGVFFNVALCDYTGSIGGVYSHKYADRLHTRDGNCVMSLSPAKKLIGKIRKERKDIFLIGFKTTSGATAQQQYEAGLRLLKENSINLVLANDVITRRNLIIVPEESWYDLGVNRDYAIRELIRFFLARLNLTYTRSTVVPGSPINWSCEGIPDSLRKVVDHCIIRGAYKPFQGKTAGHFAFKVDDKTFITTKRKTNFNDLAEVGMVTVVAKNDNEVVAYGAKPSVGGQSQRIIFKEHPEVDCIVHFHCPPKRSVKTIAQWPFECGSHECGRNTSNGLQDLGNGIKAVFLENHGPNIVFNRNIDPNLVIEYIEKTFDLTSKTGGIFSA